MKQDTKEEKDDMDKIGIFKGKIEAKMERKPRDSFTSVLRRFPSFRMLLIG